MFERDIHEYSQGHNERVNMGNEGLSFGPQALRFCESAFPLQSPETLFDPRIAELRHGVGKYLLHSSGKGCGLTVFPIAFHLVSALGEHFCGG